MRGFCGGQELYSIAFTELCIETSALYNLGVFRASTHSNTVMEHLLWSFEVYLSLWEPPDDQGIFTCT